MKTIVREAQPSDAEQLIGVVRRLAEDPGVNIVLAPGEFALVVEEERKFVADCAVSDNSLFLVAERIGRIIGVLACAGVGGGARDEVEAGLDRLRSRKCRFSPHDPEKRRQVAQ